uniref:Aerobic azoreductase n=1 Tax=Pigmentiphaga kullae TaxID=151784 RepID=Q6YAN1_9BURK|nr:aerobic azoreductase [Pigmentiphaga kullae]
MNIAIIGATGNVGSRLVNEALGRGHHVTAIARHASRLAARPGLDTLDIDLADGATVAGACAARTPPSAASASPRRPLPPSSAPSGRRPAAAAGGGRRGQLEVAPGAAGGHAHVPGRVQARGAGGRDWLNALRTEKDLDWTFLSPSAVRAGRAHGHVPPGREYAADRGGRPGWISMEDFAIAMLDEVEKPAHTGRRFTVGY